MTKPSDEIHKWLAWQALIRDPPAQLRPAQLRSYISGPDIGSVFRALWVVYRKDGAHFDLRPQLTLYPALIVEHSDDILITVIDEDQRFIVPHDPGLLPQHIREVADGSNALLQAVNTELESSVVPAGIEKFPGFQEPQAPSLIPDLRPTSAKIELLKAWRSGTNEFLLVTGSYPHFLHPEPTVAGCRFHDWAACHALGQHQGDHPIAVRSVKPQSFFRSTEQHHCAHRQVHERRERRCQIDAFEEFLCCRVCTLQTFCWLVDEQHRLPCGS